MLKNNLAIWSHCIREQKPSCLLSMLLLMLLQQLLLLDNWMRLGMEIFIGEGEGGGEACIGPSGKLLCL